MLKVTFLIFISLHGLIHLMGFIKAFRFAEINQLSLHIPKPWGIVWLLAFAVFSLSGLLLIVKYEYWWLFAFVGVVVSQVLIILYWQDAKFGTIANLLILIVVIAAFGEWNFNKQIDLEIKSIFQTVNLDERKIITSQMLFDLPHPVKYWLENSGIVGKEEIHSVALSQRGWMKTSPDQKGWNETLAEQYFNIDKPAFLWHVRMKLFSVLKTQGVDYFLNGKGNMQIKLLSIIPIVNAGGEKINEATLQRYLAEIVWFPSAALNPYIQWETLDSNSAKATMNYKGTVGSVTFYFNDHGEVSKLFAFRYKENTDDAKREKWLITVNEIKELNGIRIPIKSEITWQLSSGDFTWYKIEIENLKYNTLERFQH